MIVLYYYYYLNILLIIRKTSIPTIGTYNNYLSINICIRYKQQYLHGFIPNKKTLKPRMNKNDLS